MVLSDSSSFPSSNMNSADRNIVELVLLAQGGNEIAFGTLYQLFSISIYKYLFRIMHNRENAEDLTQEVFLKAWDKLPDLQNIMQFRSWLYRIASNAAYDHFRRKSFPSVEDIFSEPGTTIMVEDRLGKRELIGLALKQVPEKLRICLLLNLEGFSHEEIAEIVELAVKSVGTYIAQARTIFRRVYRELENS